MIPAISYQNIIRTLYAFLKEYSGLSENRIFNKDSIRGTDLSELINENEIYSPRASTSFMLFELLEDTNGEHYITKSENENSMTSVQSYIFHLTIYGNLASEDAQRVSSIFKVADHATTLREKGIFIRGVGPIEAINEFINNTLLLRRDLDIDIQVRFEIPNIVQDVGNFESLAEDIIVH